MSQSHLAGSIQGGTGLDRFPAINGLRTVAIAGVLVHHILNGPLPPLAPVTLLGMRIPLSPVMIGGQFGVNLFFILSGFVLYRPYAAGRRPMDDWAGALAFYRRRARRLLPLFYCAAVATWLFAMMRGGDGAGGALEILAVLSLTFTLNPRTIAPSFNPPLWTIGTEILFSVLFPVLVMRARAVGMARLTAAVLAFSLIARVLGIHHAPTAVFPTFAGDSFACRLDEFVLGMMLAHYHARHRLPDRPKLLFAAGVALLAGAVLGYDLCLRHHIPPESKAVLANLLDAGLCALVAAALAPGTRLQAILSWPPLQVPGMMCYSIYIWHWSVMTAVAPDDVVPAGEILAIAVPIFLLLTLAIAALSYRFIEFGHVADWKALFLLDAHREQRAGSETSASPR